MAAKIVELGESKIDKAWFESAEALQAMSILAERTQYESSSNKRQLVGEMVTNCGAVGNSTDPGKLSVLEHVSRLSSVQIGLLRVVSETVATERTGSLGGAIEVTGSAKWIDTVVDVLERGVMFWEGTLQVMEELEILIASGFLKRVDTFEALYRLGVELP